MRRPFVTVRGRLTLWTTLVVALVAVVAAAALYGQSRRALVSDVRTTLTDNLDGAREVLDRSVATELNLLALGVATDPLDQSARIAEEQCSEILAASYGNSVHSFEEFYFLLWIDDVTYFAYEDCLRAADPSFAAAVGCDQVALLSIGNPRVTFDEYLDLLAGDFERVRQTCQDDSLLVDEQIDAAAATCDVLLEGAFAGVDVLDEIAVEAATDRFLTDYATCMRENGVEAYPDLTASFGEDGSVLSGVAGSAVVIPSLESVRAGFDRFGRGMAIGVPLLLLLLAVLVWLVVGRALAPVEAIRLEVDEIGAEGLHRRVPVPTTDDEVARLAGTMNSMLDRLEAGAARQRQFVSDASHELRSPLASIRAQVEVALAHGEPDGWASVGAGVLAEGSRMEALVDDLLALARLDEGAGPRRERFDLGDLIAEEAALVRDAVVDVSGVRPVILEADPAAIRRVLRNLLANASRHARRQVTVRAAEQDGTVTILVDDDGDGLDPADRERVFERFTRLQAARSRDAGGAGLGLAVVRGIVESHGGVVRVDASPQGGARFAVDLPADRSPA